jgi:peptidoglycan/xylan/chitin deacetylase (PgdA/CDA1 family)
VRIYVRGLAETLRDRRAEREAELTLKPALYYAANQAYRRVRVARSRRSPPAVWSGVRILGYHRVLPEPDPLRVTPANFRAQLEWTLEQGIRPLRLDGAVELLADPVDGRRFCVTFDDAYHDNLDYALPILEDLAVPATIFAPTAIVDRLATYSWYRKPPAPLSWDEIVDIVGRGLVDVQAHTRTHRALTRLSDEDAREEIVVAKRELEARLPYEVTSMAYPAGLYGTREVQLVREAGYRAALTTASGLNRGGEPLETLARTMIMAGDTLEDFRAKLDGLLDEQTWLERLVRERRARTVL